MNQRWMLAALTGLLILTPIALVRADEPASEAPAVHGPDRDGFKHRLDLTDDQKQKMETVRRGERDALTPLKDKQEDLAKKLRDEVKSNAGDAELEATLKELKANRRAMRDAMEKYGDQREAVLTPKQRAQMALGMMRRMREFGRRGEFDRHDHERGEDGAPDSPGQADAQ